MDVIIPVRYRVKPQRGTEFRIWANASRLRWLLEYPARCNPCIRILLRHIVYQTKSFIVPQISDASRHLCPAKIPGDSG
jgi:hypothetical protein